MSLYASDPNNEYEPTLASDLLAIESAIAGAQPLTADRTVYCDSVAGNDANSGAQAQPFQTFARAWAERQRYGVLRAKFTIRLLGVGPYTLPFRMGASLCDYGGFLIIRGDEAAEVTHYSGTFTGDFTAGSSTIGTSAGLGADLHKNRWVKITSGPYTGVVFLILKHTDTTITACNRVFKSAGTITITAGTDFKVFTPGTQVTGGSARADNWHGGELPANADIRHVWLNLAFIGQMGSQFSEVCYLVCSGTTSLISQFSITATVFIDSTILGAHQHAYRSAGVVLAGTFSPIGGYFFGAISIAGQLTISNYCWFDHLGGRMAAVLSNAGSTYAMATSGASGELAFRYEGALQVQNGSFIRINSTGAAIEFAITSGSCIRVSRGGQVFQEVGNVSGGTTDVAGFGVDVSNGGQYFFRQAPTLTGGTAGKDLRTSNNGGVANSVLSAAGTAAGTAADALLGEVLARVA